MTDKEFVFSVQSTPPFSTEMFIVVIIIILLAYPGIPYVAKETPPRARKSAEERTVFENGVLRRGSSHSSDFSDQMEQFDEDEVADKSRKLLEKYSTPPISDDLITTSSTDFQAIKSGEKICRDIVSKVFDNLNYKASEELVSKVSDILSHAVSEDFVPKVSNDGDPTVSHNLDSESSDQKSKLTPKDIERILNYWIDNAVGKHTNVYSLYEMEVQNPYFLPIHTTDFHNEFAKLSHLIQFLTSDSKFLNDESINENKETGTFENVLEDEANGGNVQEARMRIVTSVQRSWPLENIAYKNDVTTEKLCQSSENKESEFKNICLKIPVTNGNSQEFNQNTYHKLQEESDSLSTEDLSTSTVDSSLTSASEYILSHKHLKNQRNESAEETFTRHPGMSECLISPVKCEVVQPHDNDSTSTSYENSSRSSSRIEKINVNFNNNEMVPSLGKVSDGKGSECTVVTTKVGKKQKSDERPLKPHIEDVGAELSDFLMFTKENTVHKDFSPCNKTNYDLTLQKHWTRSSEFQHQQKLSSESTKIVSEPWEDANGRISDKTEKSKLKKRRLRRAEYFVDLLLKEFNRRKQYSNYENNSVSFCGSYQDTSSFSKSIAADTATHNKPDVGTKSGQFVNKEHNVIHLRKCCQYYRCQVHSNERNVSNEKEICAKAQENLMTHILEDRNINKYSKKNMPVKISLNDSVTECNLTKCAGSACDICQCLINEAEFLFSDEDDSSY